MAKKYTEAVKAFNEQKYLYHFTDYKSAINIIQSERFRLSAISEKLNDSNEIKFIHPFIRGKVFIICFTNEIKDYFWDNYTKNCGKKLGVCFRLNNNNFDISKICRTDNSYFDYCDTSDVNYNSTGNEIDWEANITFGAEVQYFDSPSEQITYDKEFINIYKDCVNIDYDKLVDEAALCEYSGFIKNKKDWNQEQEYRIISLLRPIGMETDNKCRTIFPNFKYIYLDVSNQKEYVDVIVDKTFIKYDELKQIATEYGFNLIVNDD